MAKEDRQSFRMVGSKPCRILKMCEPDYIDPFQVGFRTGFGTEAALAEDPSCNQGREHDLANT